MFTRLMLMSKCSRDLCSWVNEFLLRFPFPRLHNVHILQLPLTHSSSSLTFIQNTVRTLSFPHMLLTTHVNLTLGSLTYTEDLTMYKQKWYPHMYLTISWWEDGNLYLCLRTMSHTIYTAKFEQMIIHQHVTMILCLRVLIARRILLILDMLNYI